jgi:hypothetical protein
MTMTTYSLVMLTSFVPHPALGQSPTLLFGLPAIVIQYHLDGLPAPI